MPDVAARHDPYGRRLLTTHQIGRSRYARGLMEGRQRARRIGALFGVRDTCGSRGGGELRPDGLARHLRRTLHAPVQAEALHDEHAVPAGAAGAVRRTGGGLAGPRSTTSTRSALGVQPIRSSSGPSACRHALVTSSETTSRTSSAAARRSALDAGSHPQSCRACRAKSRAIGTMPLACPSESVRHCRSTGTDETAPASSGSRPRSPGGCCRVVLISASPHRFAMSPCRHRTEMVSYRMCRIFAGCRRGVSCPAGPLRHPLRAADRVTRPSSGTTRERAVPDLGLQGLRERGVDGEDRLRAGDLEDSRHDRLHAGQVNSSSARLGLEAGAEQDVQPGGVAEVQA